METADGGLLIAGRSEIDLWLMHLTPDGDVAWSGVYGGFSEVDSLPHRSLAMADDQGFLVLAQIRSLVGTDTPFSDAYRLWVQKLSKSGDISYDSASGAERSNVPKGYIEGVPVQLAATTATSRDIALTVTEVSHLSVSATSAVITTQALPGTE